MNILFVSAVLPYPPHSGGQVRMFNLLKRLSEKHTIHLYSFIRSEQERSFAGQLSFCSRVTMVMRGRAWNASYILRSLTGRDSFLYTTYRNADMQSLLSAELIRSRYDVIHMEPGYVALSMPQTTVPIVVSEHNIEHDVYDSYVRHFPFAPARPFLSGDVVKMRRNEKDVWHRAAHITCVSDSDAAYVRQHAGSADVSVVPNGVDTEFFSFKPKKNISERAVSCLYVGPFSWMQNTDAVSYLLSGIWPRILNDYAGARLRIVGKNPPAHLRRFAGGAVEFVDSVSDIRTEYYGADILLAPIRIGGGTKYKIIESMASGLPVLTTPVGAQGIEQKRGKELWLARDPETFVAAVHDIIEKPDRMSVLRAARKHAESDFSWDTIASKLESVWKNTV